MNILFIVHRIPYPPNKGDKIRSFHEIRHLSKNHNLYLAFLIDNKDDLAYLEDLRQYCVAFDYDIINPKWKKFKTLPYLFTDKPLSIPYFYSKRLQMAVDRRIREDNIDTIICFSSPMAEYILKSKSLSLNLKSIKLIMDFVDVDSDKWKLYAGFNRFPSSVIYKREWKNLMKYEKKIGRTFDWSIFVSEKEVELFKSFCPEAHTVSIPNGVDFEFFNLNLDLNLDLKGPVVLFTGAMDYFPNEDAILYFSSDIWPHVKEELPDAKFYIVGGRPSKKVKELSEKDPHIIVTGYVPDVRSYLSMADIFVAPLRIARGLQNKILEAMAAGVPVVARPEAVQGLSGYNGCIQVEQNDIEFALCIRNILKAPQTKQKIVHDALKFIQANHRWEENLKKWDNLLT